MNIFACRRGFSGCIEPLEARIAPAFGPVLQLAGLDGATGFKVSGVADDDQSGTSVSAAGDVNGDGFDDVILGAPGADPAGSISGASYVLFGNASGFPPNLNLASLNGTTGFKLTGVAFEDHSGVSVSGAGDVNGDGFDDLIIGAPYADVAGVSSGASYVVFGKANFPPSFDLSTLDGINGFGVSGAAAFDESGTSVSAAGDVNGDGFADVIIGAPKSSNIGAAFIVFGKAIGFTPDLNLATLNGSNGLKLSGAASNDQAGLSVSDAGDINNDGFDDVIVGAPSADPNGNLSGASYVVFGRPPGFPPSLNLASLDGTNGFRLDGAAANDLSGFALSGAGDLNGDGFADVVVGAYRAPIGVASGAGYVVFGKAAGFTPTLNLSTLNGNNGFRVTGSASGDDAGASVSNAGDVNDDGFDDLIIGARGASPNGFRSGASYVVFGKPGGFPADLSLASLNGTNGFTLNGATAGEFSGDAVSGAGDVNQDGIDDLIIGAYLADAGGLDRGASYVVFGQANTAISINDVIVTEGNAGTATATFTVTLSAPNGQTVTVQYATADGTAIMPGDYTAQAITNLVFNPGEVSKPVSISIIGDTTFEPDETFFVDLSAPTNAVLADPRGQATILNDDLNPAALVVTTTADVIDPGDGVVSLREAITTANSTAGVDTIAFNIPGPGVQTITLASDLPAITDPVQIDGYSQPGASPNSLASGNNAVLRVQLLRGASAFDGLSLLGSNSTVRGLLINGFGGYGIRVQGTGNHTISGNWIGINDAGTADIPTSGIFLNSAGNTVGGLLPADRNVIPGSSTNGAVTVFNGSNNTIVGNFIGTNAQGAASLGAGGLSIGAADTLIGGVVAGSKNVISGRAMFINANDAVVQGNYIGVSADGTAALANAGGIDVSFATNTLIGGSSAAARNIIVVGGTGITLAGDGTNGSNHRVQGNYIGLDPSGSTVLRPQATGAGIAINGARNNTVGGINPGEGNVIANHASGIAISGANNAIQGNDIGTDATGTVARPNFIGISASGGLAVTGNFIGGTTPAERNIISGNIDVGIALGGGLLGVTTVRGNSIGVGADGSTPLGNGNGGIRIVTDGQIIGGNTIDDGNLIAFNTGDGIRVNGGAGNALRGNLIHSNTGLGIDLGGDGVTPNDVGDGDSGPNGLQNFPVIDTVSAAGPNIEISGHLQSTPNTFFLFDLYLSPAKDPSGFGEGASYLGGLGETTDANGDVQFFLSTPGTLSGFVTATATKLTTQDTSEFSVALGSSALTVTTTDDLVDPLDGIISLREAITFANSNPGLDTITFNIPGAGVQNIALFTELPEIAEAVVIDGYSQPGASPNNTPNGNNAVILIEVRNAAVLDDGLVFTADGNTVRGLAIGGFVGDAIELRSSGNQVVGNFLGLAADGTTILSNATGVLIANVPGNFIGGPTPQMRNLISGNTTGIAIDGSAAGGNLIQGNFIGTDATGTLARANNNGLVITDAADNIIGGAAATVGQGPGNLISGNATAFGGVGHGILISGAPATGNLVQGNIIGADITGTVDLGNAGSGIALDRASLTTIGGTAGGDGNLISGNDLDGILVSGPGADVNVIQGNRIGTKVDGTSALGNGRNGVLITSINALGNQIGDSTIPHSNIIAFNGGNGIFVEVGAGTNIHRNSIHSNGGLGIDLGLAGVTPNDLGDGDPGPNNLQNFPVLLTAVRGNPSGITATGTLNSTPNSNFTVEFFASAVADPTGFGEGQVFLGSIGVTTDGSGNASFTFIAGATVVVGEVISAIAIGATGDTSEFSQVQAVIDGVTTVSIGDAAYLEGQAGTSPHSFEITLSAPSTMAVSVLVSTVDGSATAGSDFTAVNGQLVQFAPGETTKLISVDLLGDVVIEDNETFSVVLSNPTNATIADDTGLGTIINDDVPSPSGDDVVFTDADGDEVTVALSKGSLPANALVFEPTAQGFFLKSVDLTPDGVAGAGINGANLSINAKLRPGGDGRVNVGRIDSTGIILKKLKIDGDVGLIEAGAIGSAKPAIKELQVVSLGAEQNNYLGSSPGGMLVQGGIGRIRVLTDVLNFAASIGVGQQASLKQLVVGGMMSGSQFEVGGGFNLLKVAGLVENTDFEVGQNFQKISVAQQVNGGSFVVGGLLGSATFKNGLKNTTFNASQAIGTLIVLRDVEASTVRVGTTLANFVVGGSLVDSTVSAPGKLLPRNAGDAMAFKILGVQEDVVRSQILAGYDRDGMAVNPDAGIGKVVIKGTLEASSIVAGASAGADGFFGNADDALLTGGNEVVAKIASIMVKGAVLGTSANPADHFGIVAEELGRVKTGGVSLPLSIGPRNDLGGFALGGTDDVRAREVT